MINYKLVEETLCSVIGHISLLGLRISLQSDETDKENELNDAILGLIEDTERVYQMAKKNSNESNARQAKFTKEELEEMLKGLLNESKNT